MIKYILEYRALGINYKLELEGNNLNDVLLYFAKNYFCIEKIHEIREKNFSDSVSNIEFNKIKKYI